MSYPKSYGKYGLNFELSLNEFYSGLKSSVFKCTFSIVQNFQGQNIETKGKITPFEVVMTQQISHEIQKAL